MKVHLQHCDEHNAYAESACGAWRLVDWGRPLRAMPSVWPLTRMRGRITCKRCRRTNEYALAVEAWDSFDVHKGRAIRPDQPA